MTHHLQASVSLANDALFMAILPSLSAWASSAHGGCRPSSSWAGRAAISSGISSSVLERRLVTASRLDHPISLCGAVRGRAERDGGLRQAGIYGAFAIDAGLMLFGMRGQLWHFHLP
jgi:hypothetical protein